MYDYVMYVANNEKVHYKLFVYHSHLWSMEDTFFNQTTLLVSRVVWLMLRAKNRVSTQFRLLVSEGPSRNPDYPVRVYEPNLTLQWMATILITGPTVMQNSPFFPRADSNSNRISKLIQLVVC